MDGTDSPQMESREKIVGKRTEPNKREIGFLVKERAARYGRA
jgi:hypothetical protein